MDERLHQPPDAAARAELGLAPSSPPPSRGSLRLRTSRAAVDPLAAYTRSGVWRLLDRLHRHWRAQRDQLYSPDPDYAAKVAHRERCLRAAARRPREVVVVLLDEMGS